MAEDSTREAVIRLEEQVKTLSASFKDQQSALVAAFKEQKDAQLQGFRDVSQLIETRALAMNTALATHAIENKADFKEDRDRLSILESGKIWILGAVSLLTVLIGFAMWYVSNFWKDMNVERRTTTTEEVRKAPEEKPTGR